MAKNDPKTIKSKSKKKKKNMGPDSVAMKKKTTKVENPFETIWSRRKFDIVGKKRKGEEVRIGLSRSRAIEKRKKTLLKEYEQSGKASVFVDKRIGEQDDGLGEFDKAIMRSQRERQLKLNKKSKYNLSDGEEDEDEIPGLSPLTGRDDFDEGLLSDDDYDNDGDEDEREKRSNFLKQLESHDPVEGDVMEGEENKHKSKKEIMEEIILKSKYFKAQKAKDKEENEQLMEDLDKTFESLMPTKILSSMTEPGKMNALKSLVNKDIPDEHVKKNDQVEKSKLDQPDSYDKLVRSMVLDMRARPSDRTKTAEEIAQDERERLERLEEERQKRMLGMDDTSDEDNEDEEKPSTQRPRSISGDDLGDSFSLDEEPKAKKGWVDEILERDNETESEDGDSTEDLDDDENEVSDEDNDASEKSPTVKDWEQSDDDDLDKDMDDEDGEDQESEEDGLDSGDAEEEMEPRGKKKSKENPDIEINIREGKSLDEKKNKANQAQTSTKPDIPFLIEAPKNFDEFCGLVDNCSNADIVVVINRIRTSNAIKLAAENRKKMQVFYGVLLQYFAVSANKTPLDYELLNLLVKPLMEMSVEIPYFAAICARQRILRARTQFCEAIKNAEDSCWPSMKTFSLLRLWSMIFPCSDFRHVVMTPAILLMCEYLMRCPIKSGRDIALGSFLCSMVLSVTKQSRKFCPEVIMFLQTVLMAATDREAATYQDSEFHHLMELKAHKPLLCIRGCVNDIISLSFHMIIDTPEDSAFFSSDNFRAGVLVTVIENLRGFVDIYSELSSFPEIFSPISLLLNEVAQQGNLPDILQEKSKDVAQLIKKKIDEHHILRRPLQMRKKKPVPIKLLNPKFEENFVKGRDYDPDRERAETRKLKKLIKREAKGAARELRKDNYFLSQVKDKEKAMLEEEKAEKYGRAKAFLQEQQHAFNSGQLGRSRKRRR